MGKGLQWPSHRISSPGSEGRQRCLPQDGYRFDKVCVSVERDARVRYARRALPWLRCISHNLPYIIEASNWMARPAPRPCSPSSPFLLIFAFPLPLIIKCFFRFRVSVPSLRVDRRVSARLPPTLLSGVDHIFGPGLLDLNLLHPPLFYEPTTQPSERLQCIGDFKPFMSKVVSYYRSRFDLSSPKSRVYINPEAGSTLR